MPGAHVQRPVFDAVAGGRRRLFVVLATLLLLLVTACGDDDAEAGADTEASAGETTTTSADTTTTTEAARSPRNVGILTEDAWGSVDVWTWIGQSRHLEGTNRITVPVQFLSDDVVTVTSIALDTPHFEPLPPEPKRSLLHPERKVALQVDVGAPRCDPLPDVDPQVLLTVEGPEQPPAELVLPVPSWLLDDLRDRECAVAALRDAVDVRFGDFGSPDRIALETELVVERRSTTDPIEIERIAGSVLLTLEAQADGTPVGTLRAGEDLLRIPVEVTATRCDAHGLAGSQKTFVFSAWVGIGDAEPVYLEVRPVPELEAAMRATLDACIRAGG